MAVHMVTQVGGEEFEVTLSRDDAGNYLAEAVHLASGHLAGTELPRVRVIDSVKERALRSLFDSLSRLISEGDADGDGPDAPAA